MLVFGLMAFFWKMVVNVYDGACENICFIVNDSDRSGF